MSIFRRNWNKPGPGVEKDEPRKKGLRRFWEVLTRDLADLIKLSGLVFLCCLPAIAAFVLLLLGPLGVLVPLLLMAPAALPVGGALCAMCYCLSQMLQDEPAFLWHDFKRKFKENFASAAIPGIICALLITAHSYSLFLYLLGGLAGSPAWMPAVWLFSVLLFAMVCPYYFLQAVYLDLGPTALLKNSLILAFAHLPRRQVQGARVLLNRSREMYGLYALCTPVPRGRNHRRKARTGVFGERFLAVESDRPGTKDG